MAPKDTVYVANEDNVCSSSASATLEFGEANLKAIAEVFNSEGDEALIKGDYQNSIQFFTEGINVNCTDKEVNATLYGSRASANYHLGCYSEALKDAEAARQYKPSHIKALITGAEACLALNLYEKAISWCGEGLKFHPENQSLLELKNEVDAKKSQQPSFQEAAIEVALASKPPLKDEIDVKKIQKLSVKKEVVEAAMASKEDKVQCQMEYSALNLDIAKKVGSKRKVGAQYLILGDNYFEIGNFEKAINYYKQFLSYFKKGEDRIVEWHAHCKLGDAYNSVGMVVKAWEFYELCLSIAIEVGDKKRENQAYCRLGSVYQSLNDFERAIEYQERHLRLAMELSDISEQGCAYGKLGSGYHSLGDLKRAIIYYETHITIIDEIGDRNGLVKAYGSLGRVYHSLHEFKRAIGYHEKQLSIAKTERRRADEARANYELGRNFEAIESLAEATQYYTSSAVLFEEIRAHFPCRKINFFQDEWKMNFFDVYQCVSTALCRTFLKQNKVSEALIAVESGRAQSLVDILRSRYGFSSFQLALPTQEAVMHDVLRWISTNTAFFQVDGDKIYIWLLLPRKAGRDIQLRSIEIGKYGLFKDFNTFIGGLLNTVSREFGRGFIKCENRCLDEPCNKESVNIRSCDITISSECPPNTALRMLYDVIIEPIADLVNGDEFIFVPGSSLWLIPFAALMNSESNYLCDSFRVRTIPSLTTLKFIADYRDDFHNKKGALLVGDPCFQEVLFEGRMLHQLPCAREEVAMIGRILGVDPLIGKEAKKDEVLRRLPSAALVHFATHGKMDTGEIALAPRSACSSQPLSKKDFILTMKDVLDSRIRAGLVVLSCCHSARGEIKAEGVVGIARAFLGAGARSVLVSLWAIDDEATLQFMKYFYEELAAGKLASEALNQAMKSMKESENFSDVEYWAPFVLIGDDFRLESN